MKLDKRSLIQQTVDTHGPGVVDALRRGEAYTDNHYRTEWRKRMEQKSKLQELTSSIRDEAAVLSGHLTVDDEQVVSRLQQIITHAQAALALYQEQTTPAPTPGALESTNQPAPTGDAPTPTRNFDFDNEPGAAETATEKPTPAPAPKQASKPAPNTPKRYNKSKR